MKKEVLLAFEKKEKKVSAETKIKSVQHISNIDYLSKVLSGIKKSFLSPLGGGHVSTETFLVQIELVVTIDELEEKIPYSIFLQKRGELNYDSFDNPKKNQKIDYLYKKFILRQKHFKEINGKKHTPYLEQLILLIESKGIPYEISKEEFYNIDEKNILVNFDSYKDFEYSIVIESLGRRNTEFDIYTPSFKKIFGDINNIHKEISFQPKHFMHFYFTSENIVDINSLLNELKSHKRYGCDNQHILKTSDYLTIEDIFRDKSKRNKLVKEHNRQQIEMDKKKKNRGYDIREMTDWSDYNDDFDMDNQSPDFWNQF